MVQPTPDFEDSDVAKLYEVFETKTYIYLIIEMCEGGELLDYLNTNGAMPEDLARVRIKEMTDVIRYLHAHDVAHLDLKLESMSPLHSSHQRRSLFPFS